MISVTFKFVYKIFYGIHNFIYGADYQVIASHRVIVEQLQSIDARFIDLFYALCLLRCVSMLERRRPISDIADIILSAINEIRMSVHSHFNDFTCCL